MPPLDDFPSLPTERPYYSALLVDDDGHLWVRDRPWSVTVGHLLDILGSADGPIIWWVFDSEGRWLGGLAIPAGVDPHVVADGRLIAVETDAFGVETVAAGRRPPGRRRLRARRPRGHRGAHGPWGLGGGGLRGDPAGSRRRGSSAPGPPSPGLSEEDAPAGTSPFFPREGRRWPRPAGSTTGFGRAWTSSSTRGGDDSRTVAALPLPPLGPLLVRIRVAR